MRGTWDDVNQRLASSLLSLDMGDRLTVGDRRATAKAGLLGRSKPVKHAPRRWVQATGMRTVLIAECVGATEHGGEWEMTPEQRQMLEKMGWQPPWSPDYPTYQREVVLQRAPHLANLMARTLRELGCEVADLEAELTQVDTQGM